MKNNQNNNFQFTKLGKIFNIIRSENVFSKKKI